eukprot:9485853-Lingulodinium_polyedra.AAC.1
MPVPLRRNRRPRHGSVTPGFKSPVCLSSTRLAFKIKLCSHHDKIIEIHKYKNPFTNRIARVQI